MGPRNEQYCRQYSKPSLWIRIQVKLRTDVLKRKSLLLFPFEEIWRASKSRQTICLCFSSWRVPRKRRFSSGCQNFFGPALNSLWIDAESYLGSLSKLGGPKEKGQNPNSVWKGHPRNRVSTQRIIGYYLWIFYWDCGVKYFLK